MAQTIKPALHDVIVAMRRAGKPTVDIAEVTGIKDSTITVYCHRHKIPRLKTIKEKSRQRFISNKHFSSMMPVEIPTHIIEQAWNQVEEVKADYDQLTDEELTGCRETINRRLGIALDLLGKYVKDPQA